MFYGGKRLTSVLYDKISQCCVPVNMLPTALNTKALNWVVAMDQRPSRVGGH